MNSSTGRMPFQQSTDVTRHNCSYPRTVLLIFAPCCEGSLKLDVGAFQNVIVWWHLIYRDCSSQQHDWLQRSQLSINSVESGFRLLWMSTGRGMHCCTGRSTISSTQPSSCETQPQPAQLTTTLAC